MGSMTKLKFIEPTYARAVEKLPEGRDWLYEIKLDGYRCLAGRDAKGVILWSRTANIFTTQFPCRLTVRRYFFVAGALELVLEVVSVFASR